MEHLQEALASHARLVIIARIQAPLFHFLVQMVLTALKVHNFLLHAVLGSIVQLSRLYRNHARRAFTVRAKVNTCTSVPMELTVLRNLPSPSSVQVACSVLAWQKTVTSPYPAFHVVVGSTLPQRVVLASVSTAPLAMSASERLTQGHQWTLRPSTVMFVPQATTVLLLPMKSYPVPLGPLTSAKAKTQSRIVLPALVAITTMSSVRQAVKNVDHLLPLQMALQLVNVLGRIVASLGLLGAAYVRMASRLKMEWLIKIPQVTARALSRHLAQRVRVWTSKVTVLPMTPRSVQSSARILM